MTALLLLVVVPILIVGGITVRRLVADGFRAVEQVRAAQLDAAAVLAAQLDEETGIRGYAATHQSEFLAPFEQGRRRFADSFAALDRDAQAVPLTDTGTIADLKTTNQRWLRSVAMPLLTNPSDADVIQRFGKVLIDHFRADITQIEDQAEQRQAALDVSTRRTIDRINLFVLVAVVIVALAALGFGALQARLAGRLEEQERAAAGLRVAYETERRIAETLQGAFLQRPLPTTPTVSFSATYVPATEETNVGGDWYDGVELSKGRVMFVIGDVAGHGLDAAVSMNRTRQALLSAAVLDPDPAALLVRVNAELVREHGRMVTAVCGYADTTNYVFTYATAGHPPPVLFEPGRAPRLLDFGGLPLGIVEAPVYQTFSVQTLPGAMLILYTDGAVEHSRDVVAGERQLLDAVAASAGSDLEHVAARIHEQIFAGRAAGDDVAILTVMFAAQADAGSGGGAARAIVAAGARGREATLSGRIVSLDDRLRRPKLPTQPERPSRRIAS
jgi:serine phosphatase RsbU (regulator of sigma subunit)